MKTKQAYTLTFATKIETDSDSEKKMEEARDIIDDELTLLNGDAEYEILDVSVNGDDEHLWKTMQIDIAFDPHDIVLNLFSKAETADLCGSYPDMQLSEN